MQVLPAELSESLSRLTLNIDNAEKSIQQIKDLEDGLDRLRTDVESILTGSTETADTLRPRLAEVKGQIAKLGPAPSKELPEAAEMAAERGRLEKQAATLDGAIKSAELTWVRARQLIERITVLRHALFAKSMLERLPSPLLPAHWRDMWQALPSVSNRVKYLSEDWMTWGRPQLPTIGAILAFALLLYAASRAAIEGFTRRRAVNHPEQTTFFERAGAVAWTAPARMIPGAIATAVVYLGLDALDLIYPPWDKLALGVLKAIAVFVVSSAIIRTVFAPRRSKWRLVALSDQSAGRIVYLLQGASAIYAVDAALADANRAFFVPLSITVVQSFVLCLATSAVLIAILMTPFARPGERLAEIPRREPRWLKIPLWLLAIGIIGAALLGYVALARFMAQQVVLSGMVLGVVALFYLAIRTLTREPVLAEAHWGSTFENQLGLDPGRRRQIAWLAEMLLTFGLALVTLPVVLLQWGFSGADIRDWVKAALFGFEIGHFKISLARIFIGGGIFTALVIGTRIIQRVLRDNVLANGRFDPGVANSIETAVGYLGVILGGLIAVSYAGFDVTNLAIVAGALSVGIGFGLQSIVNNFVSGLILLVERPIKVGDWIVLGDQQGNVRRISVRATEIETFDRASLIVPNAELIQGRVLNWTHRNLLGRAVIKVSTNAEADPEQVMTIILGSAKAHPAVLDSPPPACTLDTVNPTSLDFTLRITLGDVTNGSLVQNEVKIAILKGLRAAGVYKTAA